MTGDGTTSEAASSRPLPPPGATGPTSVRLDVWLWSARLMPTRSAATAACRAGHVRRNGEPVKAAQRIVVGDELRIRTAGRERIVVVTMILVKRVGAPVARTAYVDHSPEPPPQLAAAPPRRDRGSGRPTKRERRALDRLRGRDEQLRLLEDEPEDA
ncbi:RNA-binding S4 domain-containing protein [Brachybacterium sp. J153]|uniref:RNA-binding S4 domain-containing protein n=1 Tax=Brachybacterium sp. J153 TaxID=3116488 RepID=UPI002E79661A|nr:RNA-binding S4 domain-containing protein [Brachybacterium sp. J153]MEE1619157.1 RNA-binding S4 domain-containing protein [Brachybacterium sp. J153]